MLNIKLDQARTILCLGAHADDIEIGCGGTLLKLLAQNENLRVYWVVMSASPARAAEAKTSAAAMLTGAAESKIVVNDFQDTFFPYDGRQINEYFRQLGREVSPDVVFTHRREDLHQDHRLLAELTWNTFRDHLILEYEIPKYEGDLGHPNLYVPLDRDTACRKVDTIVDSFQTQHDKRWFSADTFWALMRLRGLECNSPSALAEGLYCRKLVL